MTDDVQLFPARTSVLGALTHVLVNGRTLISVARVAEWNVCGFERVAFKDVGRRHRLEMEDGLDDIAARMRVLDGRPGIDHEPGATCVAAIGADTLTAKALATMLRDGHREMIDCLLAADDVARDADDGATSLMLTRRISAHQLHLEDWSSCLSGE